MKRVLLGTVFGAALTAAVPALAADDISAIVKLRTVDIEVTPDGLYTRTVHVEIQATNAAAAQEIGQQPVPFSESLEDLEIVDAYTLKSGGEKLAVGMSAIYTQQSQGSTQYPQFDDHRQKVIVFPNLSSGDTVAYTARWRTKKAPISGQFFYHSLFPKGVAYEQVEETIRAPKNFPLQVENHEVEFDKQETGDTVTYHWRYRAPRPVVETLPHVSPLDSMPRFLVSSVKNYDEFGQLYATMAAPSEVVTPKIQALADQLTAGVTDRRAQVQKIYEWVSKNIRYVAVTIGNAGWVPHTADSVLANAYGDCKDHAALFATLLKAKAIASETVLINADDTYTLPAIANLMTFDHVITWLPEFKLYADTTAGVAPFGVLPFSEYGKPVVHAVTQGPSRHQTPVLGAQSASLNLKTVARIDQNGKITGNNALTATGPFLLSLRAMGLAIQGVGPARFASEQLQKIGFPGTGSVDVPPPTEISNVYTLQGNFSYELKRETALGGQFEMVRGLMFGVPAGDDLMGPLFDEKIKDTEPTACFSGHMVEELSLEAPEGRVFAQRPRDVSVRTRNVRFTASWSLSGKTLTVRREFVSTIDQPLCDGAVRRDAARVLTEVRRHYNTDLVSLAAPSNLRIDYLAMMKGGDQALMDKDEDSALRLYNAAIELMPPDAPAEQIAGVRTARGIIYNRRKEYSKAMADYGVALRASPNNLRATVRLADSYSDQKKRRRAIAAYTDAIRIKPDDPYAYMARADEYSSDTRYVRSIEDCDAALRLPQANSYCYWVRGRSYFIKGEYEKAIADMNQRLRVAVHSDVYFDRARSYLMTGQYRNAISDFDDATRGRTKPADVLYGRGIAKIKNGNTDAGEADIAAATKMEPGIASRMRGFGIALSSVGKDVDNFAACTTKEIDNRDTYYSLWTITTCLHAMNSPSLSLDQKVMAYRKIGDAYVELTRWDEAIFYFDEALRLKPDDAAALGQRGYANVQQRDYDRAIEDLTKAIGRDANLSLSFVARGMYYAATGNLVKAEADFAEALRLDPKNEDAYYRRATMYEQNEQFDKAAADVSAAIAIRQDNNLYSYRCYVLAFADRLTQAMADCDRNLQAQPNHSLGHAARGYIFMKLGQDAKALEEFNASINANAEEEEVAYYGRGLLKLKSGDASGNDDIAEATFLDADLVARMRRRGLKP